MTDFLHDRIVVAFVGINQPGYSTIANAYLREAVKADVRLPEVWAQTIDFFVDQDPWWMFYQLAALDPMPDIISFSVYCWNAEIVFKLTDMLSRMCKDTKIVLGGPEVGPRACEVLREHPELYAVVAGEGEKSVPALLLSFARGGEPYGIPGVAFETAQGVKMAPEEPIEPLDAIKPPCTPVHGPALNGAAYLETFRGCPHACAYCFEAKGSTRIRAFSWKRVEEDVARLASTPGLKSFTFIDSVFNLTLSRLEKLAEILEPWAQKGMRLHTIEVDIEAIDEYQAHLLKKCGVISVETGPQTTSTATLKSLNRSLDEQKFIAGVAACRNEGISVEADLIIGLPGDGIEEVLKSMHFALKSGADKVQMSTLHVLPGTPLWDQADEYGLVYDKNAPHEIMQTRELKFRELRQLEVFGVALSKLISARV